MLLGVLVLVDWCCWSFWLLLVGVFGVGGAFELPVVGAVDHFGSCWLVLFPGGSHRMGYFYATLTPPDGYN